MMLHQDGSRHAWLEGQPPLALIVTLDDATGEIYSAFLVEEEDAASTVRALKEVFKTHGLAMSLHTDRGGHYFFTPEAGGEVDRNRLRQVGRALKQLGGEHIGAYSGDQFPANPFAISSICSRWSQSPRDLRTFRREAALVRSNPAPTRLQAMQASIPISRSSSSISGRRSGHSFRDTPISSNTLSALRRARRPVSLSGQMGSMDG
jgi:hypothetical protein